MIYFLEEHQLKILETVMKGLFGDGTALTPDQRRDLANTMNVILSQINTQKFGVPK